MFILFQRPAPGDVRSTIICSSFASYNILTRLQMEVSLFIGAVFVTFESFTVGKIRSFNQFK